MTAQANTAALARASKIELAPSEFPGIFHDPRI
jgi:hypothetical protein